MRLALAAAIAVAIFVAAGPTAAFSDEPGTLVSPGASPFSERWESMQARDMQSQPAFARAPMSGTRVIPRPLRPRFSGTLPSVMSDLAAAAAPLPQSPQSIGAGFAGLNLQDEISLGVGAIPPDTMGAIGPNHFLEMINSSVAAYTRAGTRLSNITLDSFFTVTVNGTTYPRFGTTDPHVVFDRRSGRWFACCLEFGTSVGSDNNIMLAVCRTSDPLNGVWDKYVIPVAQPDSGQTSYLNDYDSLGVDDNGVYFGMNVFPSAGNTDWARIAATPKAPLVAASPSLGPVYQWNNITDMYASPQPAHNLDASANGREWFVASSTTTYGNVNYRTLGWVGGAPSISATSVLTSPAYGAPIDAPANGSSTNINVGDDRLLMAVIRSNRLWTSRNVGVNSSGGSSRPNRTACEWLELDVTNSSAGLLQSGRVYDPAASNPRYYYYPSLMVNGQGNVGMGFSGSKSTEYVGGYTCGRLVTDSPGTMGAVSLIKSGDAPYLQLDGTRNRWGDYSYTSLDPNDDMSMWTIQEYATNVGSSIWGTWTTQLLSPAPTLVNPSALGCAGQAGNMITLSGTGFYDPGPGFQNRLTVSLVGGSPDGISNVNVVYNSPTSVTVTFDVAANASAGPRDIVLTNPDGQSVTAAGGLTIDIPVSITSQPQSMVACLSAEAQFCVSASGTAPLSYQWSKNGVPISGATASCYSIASSAAGDSGTYTCAVTNPCGTVTSSQATLAVAPCMTIDQAKQSPDGTSVALIGKTVTASLSDCFYAEESSRDIGIRINGAGPAGVSVDVAGTMATNANYERYIAPALAVPHSAASLAPVAVANKYIGGGDWFYLATGGQKGVAGSSGLNNIGLLVKTWGKFTLLDPQTFTVDDGSGLNIKCVVPAGVSLSSAWTHVAVTGIVSCEYTSGALRPLIRVRAATDITPY